MTSVNVTTQSNTVTVQQGDATTVTIATQGPQGPAGVGSSITINNNGTSKVITGSGTANTLNANTNLTFDGTTLDVKSGNGVINAGQGTFNGTVDLSSAESNSSNTAQFKLSNLTIGQHNNIGSYRFANAGTGSFLLTADNINFFNKDVNKSFLRLSASAVELYHNNVKKAETSSTGFDVIGSITASTGATFGGSATFASDGYLTTTTGITIENSQPGIIFSDTTANPDFIIQNRDGSFAIRDTTNAANRFLIDTANGNITATGNINLPDNSKLQLGGSQDLEIYHSGNHSFIRDTGTGNLYIDSNQINFRGALGEQLATFTENGSVELYHDNVKKAETSADGLNLPDNTKLQLGDSQDLQIYHDSNNSVIDSNTGNLYLQSGNNLFIQGANNENIIKYIANGAVEIYHDNVKKAQTSSTGFDIPEDFIAGSGSKLTVGASGDLTFFHDSANSYVQNNTGDLILGDTNHQYFRGNTSDKSVSLYFNGSEKVKTTNTGITVTGSVTTQDMNMSNLNGTANEVDNTKGSWSIQEGADDLFLINRVSGKKYKFNLTEIS